MKQKTYIGGQAVIEGVMMRGKRSIATAVRDGEGNIRIEAKRLPPPRKGILTLPFFRGSANLISSTVTGMKCLMRSAEVFGTDEGEPSAFEKKLSEKFRVDLMDVVTTLSLILGVALAFGLFLFLPQFLTGLIASAVPAVGSGAWYYVIVGAIKLVLFIGYLCMMLLIKDMRRTFMYHGAEHKTITCYESGKPLTVENVRSCSRVHDRCGTTFLFLVVAVNILVFALVGWALRLNDIEGNLLRFVARLGTEIVLLPVVAGISYEILRLLAKTESKWAIPFKAPGLLLQRITTQEPTDDMIEVAIASFERVLAMEADETVPETDFVLPEKLSVLLAGTKKQFAEAEIDESDAEWIYSIVLGVRRSDLVNERTISASERMRLEEMIGERLSGRPLWYIVGDTEFCGVKIKVDERALIPRPETEELADLAIREIRQKKFRRVIDVCTGSGCIAVAIAKATGAEVLGTDLSPEAISLARENAEANGASVTFFEGDLMENAHGLFDLIVCNPPYVPTGYIPNMQKEVLRCEPHMALDGGEDGMNFYRRMAREALPFIKEGGELLFECGEGQAESIAEMFEKESEIIRDLEGVERIVKIIC
ncbi:MAG: peptide chain release factor N(5)-glutamine methyltransferase [Christensenellaceae bacterium]